MIPIIWGLAFLSAVWFGASTPFATGLGLAVVHLSRSAFRLPAVEVPLRRQDARWLGLVILTGGVGGPLLLMFGLAWIDAAGASLLLNLDGENVDRKLLFGAFAILAGAALLSWNSRASLDFGGLLIAGACPY